MRDLLEMAPPMALLTVGVVTNQTNIVLAGGFLLVTLAVYHVRAELRKRRTQDPE